MYISASGIAAHTNIPPRNVPLPGAPNIGAYKPQLPHNLLRWAIFSADLACTSLIAMVALLADHTSILDTSLRTALPYMLIPVAAMLGLVFSRTYSLGFSRSIGQHLVRAFNGAGTGLAILTCLLGSLSSAPVKNVLPLILVWLAIGALHVFYVIGMKRLFRAGHLSEKVIIIGATQKAKALIAQNHYSGDLRVLGVFDDRAARTPELIENVPFLGGLDDLMMWDRLPEVDRIIVTISPDARDRVHSLIEQLRILPNRIVLLLDFTHFEPESSEMVHIGASPAAYVSGNSVNLKHIFIKRLIDIVFGDGLLIAFSPVMLFTAFLIKLEDGGPIFFKQLRQGYNNELIRVWKFRSMQPNEIAENRMSHQTTLDDPRVTRIGRFIRASSIDELPQFFNVLAGNMSLVGPRPHAIGMTAESTMVHEIVAEYAHRHRAKPGLTGWAQINGSRGPVNTHTSVRQRVELDMEYLKRSSFLFDLYIMFKTAPCLLGDRQKTR